MGTLVAFLLTLAVTPAGNLAVVAPPTPTPILIPTLPSPSTPTPATAGLQHSTNEGILGDWLAAIAEEGPTPAPQAAFEQASALLPSPVVMYSTQWCTFCHKAKDWLTQRGIEFIERDIEEDPEAASELARKALAAGIKKGGVPIFDVDGELVLGFDVGKLEELLEARER